MRLCALQRRCPPLGASICASTAVSLLCLLTTATDASAQTHLAGSVGGGVVDENGAAVASAELHYQRSSFAAGLALRLRLVEGRPLTSDWDELGDAGRVIRYVTYEHTTDNMSVAFAAGHLGNIQLGHGILVSGYAAGLDFDRGRAGAELRQTIGRGRIHVFTDDITAAEIVAANAAAPVLARSDSLVLGVGAVYDRTVETALASASAELGGSARLSGATIGAALYTEIATRVRHGGGVSGGAKMSLVRGATSVQLRGEARRSTAGFTPGWISPMYLRDRRQIDDSTDDSTDDSADDSMDALGLTEHLEMNGRSGTSWLAGTQLSSEVVTLSASLETRPSLPWQMTARVAFPAYRELQAGGWLVVTGTGASAFAAELRARLPGALFARGELARQYAAEAGRLRPISSASLSIGAVMGD